MSDMDRFALKVVETTDAAVLESAKAALKAGQYFQGGKISHIEMLFGKPARITVLGDPNPVLRDAPKPAQE